MCSSMGCPFRHFCVVILFVHLGEHNNVNAYNGHMTAITVGMSASELDHGGMEKDSF